MSMAVGNPEHIDAIASALEAYVHVIEDETNRFNSAFGQYSDSWQDEKRQEFEDTYRQLCAVLEQFKESATDQVTHLRILAERLRAYLAT